MKKPIVSILKKTILFLEENKDVNPQPNNHIKYAPIISENTYYKRFEKYLQKELGYPLELKNVNGATWIVVNFKSHIYRHKINKGRPIDVFDSVIRAVKWLKTERGHALMEGNGI